MKKFIIILMSVIMIVSCSSTNSSNIESNSIESSDTEYEYVEEIVTIQTATHEIPATILKPITDNDVPFVVMLHGTGSNRDEAGGGYKIAAPILAKKYGIASIRIDFIGNGESKEDYIDYNFTSAVNDALEAKKYMSTLEGIDPNRAGIMGWSQGGTIAMLATGWNPDEFKSVVTWAGAPDLSSLLDEENFEEANVNGYFVMNFDWRSSLNVSKQWCDDVKNTDVLNVFSAFQGPVLAIAGKLDDTVDPEWANKIVQVSNNNQSQTYFIDGMDHTFNVFSEQDFKSITNATYKTGEFFKATL